MNIAVCAHHARHGTVGVAGNDVATVLDPQVRTVFFATTVFGPVMSGALADVVIEHRHHARVILGVDHVLPGEDAVFQGVVGVAKHFVPAGIAVDEAGIGVPVPDAITDQFHDGVQQVDVKVGHFIA